MGDTVKMTLEAARVNCRLGQKEAAKLLGISNKTLSSWERGASLPTADRIPDICALYGVSYDNLKFLRSDSL